MSPVEGAGQGPRQNRMSAAITQGGTLGPETTRKEAPCGQSQGLGAGDGVPRGCLLWLGALWSGRPELVAALLSGMPAGL